MAVCRLLSHAVMVKHLFVFGFIALLLGAHPQCGSAQNPDWFASLALWARADSGISLLTGPLIQQWDDLSGNGRNLTQTSSGAMPQIAEDALNGHRAVVFNGVNSRLLFEQVAEVRTVVWVLREDEDYGPDDITYRHFLGNQSSDPFFRGQNRRIWREGVSAPNVLNGATRIGFEYVDGSTTVMPNGWQIMVLVTDGDVPASIIGRSGVVAGSWKGRLAELMVFTEPLSHEEILELETWLLDYYTTPLTLGDDIVVEYGFCDTLLTVPEGFSDALWSTGETTTSIAVNTSGTYWVQARDELGRLQTDTVMVSFPGTLDFAPLTTVCVGESILLDTGLNPDDYVVTWSTETVAPTLTIDQPGTYAFSVVDTLGCDFNAPPVVLDVDSFSLTHSLGPDRNLCSGNVLPIFPSADGMVDFLWMDAFTESAFAVFESGEYYLEAVNVNGCLLIDTVAITISGVAPSVDLIAPTLLCQNAPLAFEVDVEADSELESIVWQLPNGTTSSGNEVDFTPIDWGPISLSVEVITAAGCATQTVFEDTVNPSPAATLFHQVACTGNNFFVTALPAIPVGSVETIVWSFDGQSAEGNQAAFVPENSGFQPITLTLTSNAGCVAEQQQLVDVKQTPVIEPIAPVTCKGDLTSFVAEVLEPGSGSITSWQWFFGDNTGSTIQNPTHFYPNSGNYNVAVQAISSFGCMFIGSVNALVVELPEPAFTTDVACAGQPLELNDASTSEDALIAWVYTLAPDDQRPGPSVEVVFASVGEVPVTLTVESENGCTASVTQVIAVFEVPEVGFSVFPSIGLPPLEVAFTNASSGAAFYAWSIEGETVSQEVNSGFVFNQEGLYDVTLSVTSSFGCTDALTQQVNVTEPLLDLVMAQLFLNTDESGIGVIAGVFNAGNHTPSSAVINAQLGNGTVISESLSTLPQPGQYLEVPLSGRFIANNQSHAYLCAEVSGFSPFGVERTPFDNRQCKSTEATFEISTVFPNPLSAGSSLAVRVVTAADRIATLEVFDSVGRLVLRTTPYPLQTGFNELQLPTERLEPGSYVLRYSDARSETTLRFAVVR